MIKDMYSAVSEIQEEPEDLNNDLMEDDLSDKSDIEYKNYSV